MKFEKGKKYLVYASLTKTNQLFTGFCSRTSLLTEAENDLAYIRSVKQGNAGQSICP